jgi:transposase-like protein
MVAAAIKTIFAQPDRAHIHRQLDEVADTLRPGFPEAARLPEEAKADLLAFSSFSTAYWTKIWSTSPSRTSSARGAVLGNHGLTN